MSTTIIAAVVAVVAALTLVMLGQLLWFKPLRRDYAATLRAVRWWMVPTALANVAVVLFLILGLTTLAPLLWFGWWKLLGGTGNVWFGQTGQAGVWWQTAAIGIPVCLLVLVPGLAYGEEVGFRLGSEKQGIATRLRRQLLFGLMHCVAAGVPVAAGLALTFSGFYYERVYLNAVRRLTPEIEAAGEMPEYARIPYPERPSGTPYDAAAWDRHRQEFDAIQAENRRRLDEWLEGLPARVEEGVRRADELRKRAVAEAAAAHAVSNGMLIVTLIITLLVAYI